MAAARIISADGMVLVPDVFLRGSGMKSVKLYVGKMERAYELQIVDDFFGKMRKCYVGFLNFRMPFFFPFKTVIPFIIGIF